MQSFAPALDTVTTLTQAEQTTGAEVAEATGFSKVRDVAACLRALDTEKVVKAVPARSGINRQDYGPNVDGFVLTGPPLDVIGAGMHNRLPLVIGTNAEETYLGFPLGSIADDTSYQNNIHEKFGQVGGDMVLGQYPSTSYPRLGRR